MISLLDQKYPHSPFFIAVLLVEHSAGVFFWKCVYFTHRYVVLFVHLFVFFFFFFFFCLTQIPGRLESQKRNHCELFCHVWLFVTPWTVAHQAPLSMGFPRQEYWNGVSFPPPGDLPHPGNELESPLSPELAGGFFTTSVTWEAPEKEWTSAKHPGKLVKAQHEDINIHPAQS